MKLRLQFIIAAFFALAVYNPVVYGQANLTFDGGNSTPFTITLQQSVTYTITNENCAESGPLFVFDEVGNPFFNFTNVVSGSMTFSIGLESPIPIVRAASGSNAGNITPNDIFVYGNAPGAAFGTKVVLNAGSVTTNELIVGFAPNDGSYATFLINTSGVRCSSDGVALGTTAAPVFISGRVFTGNGRGLSNAVVYLTDQEGNSRSVRTNAFGHYRFADVQAGQSATLTVVSKRYQFASKVINLNEAMTNLDFVAEP